jgi:hypothetical protein
MPHLICTSRLSRISHTALPTSLDPLRRAGRGLSLALALSVGWLGLTTSAQAGLIGAQQVAQAAVAGSPQARLQAAVDRADVQRALVERGVDPLQAQARIAALSDDQANALLAEIDRAPAGASGVLETAVFVFVLLLVTDVLGFTKVFPFTRSIR